MGAADFWSDRRSAQHTIEQKNNMERQLQSWSEMDRRMEDLDVMLELVETEGDAVMEGEISTEIGKADQALAKLRVNLLLNGEKDASNAIIAIHPGAGGTESQDWAEMLMRLYVRWAEN